MNDGNQGNFWKPPGNLVEKPIAGDDYECGRQGVFEAGTAFSNRPPAIDGSDYEEPNSSYCYKDEYDKREKPLWLQGSDKKCWQSKLKKFFHGAGTLLMLVYGVPHPIHFLIHGMCRLGIWKIFALDPNFPASPVVRQLFGYVAFIDGAFSLGLFVFLSFFGSRYFPEWEGW